MSETTQVRLTLFKGGYCTHSEKMVLRTGRRRQIAFPSLFALIEHPTQGALLYDTGYGSHFFSATEGFPERIYRMVTPVTLDSRDTAVAKLALAGYQPEDIRLILISHFHGDHVAALKDFPKSRFVFLAQGYQAVKSLRGTRAVRIGFLPDLLPPDFTSRTEAIEADSPLATEPLAPFAQSFDLFGDGSILLIPLEGHFCGQMGAWLNTTRGPVLLVADACWLRESFEKLILPHPLAMGIMHDRRRYLADLEAIQGFQRLQPQTLIIPSHCTRSIDAYQPVPA
ncbi:MAG: MBL fold metallo-hydrolase [Candidatus Sericytochromatia bacterium]